MKGPKNEGCGLDEWMDIWMAGPMEGSAGEQAFAKESVIAQTKTNGKKLLNAICLIEFDYYINGRNKPAIEFMKTSFGPQGTCHRDVVHTG